MIVNSGANNYALNGIAEITTVLSALFGVLTLVLLVVLYVSRKWCFHARRGINCCDDKYLPTKCLHKLSRRRHYENTSSDSDEDILRRLRLQQARLGYTTDSLNVASNTNYGINQANPLSQNYHHYINSDLNRVIVNAADGSTQTLEGISTPASAATATAAASVAASEALLPQSTSPPEYRKIDIVSSHSECSSNDSIDTTTQDHSAHSTVHLFRDKKSISVDKLPERNIISSIPGVMKETRIETNASSNATNVIMQPKLINTIAGMRQCSSEEEALITNAGDNATIPNSFSNNNCNRASVSSINSTIISTCTNSNTAANINKINCKNPPPVHQHHVEEEPLFDTSDLRSIKSDENCMQSQCYGRSGSIEISLLYDAPMRKMTVHVLQASGLPVMGNGQQTHTQVRLLMLPNKKQKYKTKIRSGENPQYMESFLLDRVTPEEVNNMGLRVRLYGCERLRKERLIGEAYISFATIDLEMETNLWLPLEPRNTSSVLGSTSDILSLARSDSAGSTTSIQHGGVPELLLGLGYNGITGRLTVEIVKGSHFRSPTLNKAPNTYVKLCLVSSIGQEISRAKTSIRRGQPNPLFKETFVFQVALFQLNDVTLMVSVYAKRNMKKNEMVGWFSLGLNSSGPEEIAHWLNMRNAGKGELLTSWHTLVDS